MLENSYLDWIYIELIKQLDRLDVDVRVANLDKLIEMLSHRKDLLTSKEKHISKFEIRPVREHFMVFKDGEFFCSADTEREAEQDIQEFESIA